MTTTVRTADGDRPRTFSRRERRILRCLAEALFTDGTSSPEFEARLDWVVDDIDGLVGASGLVTRAGLRGLLNVMQTMPPAFGYGPRTLTTLPLERRVSYLEKLELASGLGMSVVTWKILLGTSYFEHPEALSLTTYDGECLGGEGSLTRGTRRPSRSLRVVPGDAARTQERAR
jgi:hypothetical protein